MTPTPTATTRRAASATRSDFVNENNTDFLLTAVTTPLERLGLTMNFGGNRRTRSLNQRWLGTDKLVTPGVYNMTNAATAYKPVQYDERRQINSLYGTTQFASNDYFFVDVTGRNDWSSTLPKGKNSYSIPRSPARWSSPICCRPRRRSASATVSCAAPGRV